MNLKALRRSFGLLLLADGARAVISPFGHTRKFQLGSPLLDDILDYVADNPELTRKVGIGELALGLWLTLA
jgi:hypothetical protein